MREIIAVCRSEKRSRDRVARVLDRYFWRIGDRTWRGKATNACLDRVSRELRKRATRNTAVVIHEIRSSAESRVPIIRIGAKHAFSEEGVVPVSSHPAQFGRGVNVPDALSTGAAAVAIAALFHDLGKATLLFQGKLARALTGGDPEADPVRHELFSAAVWDELFGNVEDGALTDALTALTPEKVDAACKGVRRGLVRAHSRPEDPLKLRFLTRVGTLTHLIGMLILTHHRLPEAESDHLTLTGTAHVRPESPLNAGDLAIASGTPFWHEGWWGSALRAEAGRIRAGALPASGDIALRASLMFADHVGSARKAPSGTAPDQLANTIRPAGSDRFIPADSLSRHVKRVTRYARFAHEMTHQLRDRYPALAADQVPVDIALPAPSTDPRFAWQAAAAVAARQVCETRDGGFFGAILAGTGTGKTRGAPTILAAAALSDRDPSRRQLRMSLGLGLRALATQSAREYVDDLGFRAEDVSVLIGDPPLSFRDDAEPEAAEQGSESLVRLPDWLRVEQATGGVPEVGSDREADWLRGLSLDSGRGLPAFLDLVLEASGRRAGAGRRLISAPVMVGTVDHLMGVASPTSSRFLLQSLRVLTSDLILDEIDQYDGEDLAAIARLVFQAGAAGRRVLIMSATLTADVAEALHLAYRRGWSEHARALGVADHVNLLLCGDTPDSVVTNAEGGELADLLRTCQDAVLAGIRSAPALRRAELLPPCEGWAELVAQVDAGCSRLHDLNAVDVCGFRVSVGLVRLTRISHAAAMATQLGSGALRGRLRVLVCLHAQMPRLHRAYIERRLKRALTRKGADPEAGVRSLCHAEGVLERAAEIGATEVEIVVVTTPVIETGNDLDFDYGVLDPISTRSVIQSAGRVRRHRPTNGALNVLILGRSPVAMQGGALAMPGVETRPASETGVPISEGLTGFEGRLTADLTAGADLSVISAAPVLSEEVTFPLKTAETGLRNLFLSSDPRDPLGRYMNGPNARWNRRMTRTRRFRRSETREVLFTLVGEDRSSARWFLDLDPGTRNSALREAGDRLRLTEGPDPFGLLFEDLTTGGWTELTGGLDEMAETDLRELFRVSVPSFGDDLGSEMTYNKFTGFTRGSPEDLFSEFGRREKNQ